MEKTFKIERREKHIVTYYNEMTGSSAESFSDIPQDALGFLLAIEYKHILKPLIRKKLELGHSERRAAMFFDVKRRFVRGCKV